MYVPVQCDVRLGDIPPNRQYAAAMLVNVCVDGPAYPPQRCFRITGTTRLTYAYELSLGNDDPDDVIGLSKRQLVQRAQWQSHVSGGYVKDPSNTTTTPPSSSAAVVEGEDGCWGLLFHAHPHTVGVTGAKVHIGSKRTIAVKKIRRVDLGGDDVAFDSINTGVFEAVLAEPLPTGPTAAGQTIALSINFTTAVRPAMKSGGGASNGHGGMCGLYYSTAPSSGNGAWGSDLAASDATPLPKGGAATAAAAISASEYAILSHFEVHHARRAFPCIDDPKVRLVWGLSMSTSTPGADGGPFTSVNSTLLQVDPMSIVAAAAATTTGKGTNNKVAKGGKATTLMAIAPTAVPMGKVVRDIQSACEVIGGTTSGGVRFGFFCTPPSSCSPAEAMIPEEDPSVANSLGFEAESCQFSPACSAIEFHPTPLPIPAYTVGLALLLGRDHPSGSERHSGGGGIMQRIVEPVLEHVTTSTLLRVIHFPSLLHAVGSGGGGSKIPSEITHFMRLTLEKAAEGLCLLERDTFKSPIPLGYFSSFLDDGSSSLYTPPCTEAAVASAAGSGCEGRRLNLIFVPAMPIGGMEHHGNIFLNESIIRPPLKTARVKVEDEVVTLVVHELCHHWLGNAVGLPFEIKEGLCQVLERAIGNSIQGIGGAPKVAAMKEQQPASSSSSSAPSQCCGKGGSSSSGAPKEGDELTGLTYQHALNHIQRAVGVCGWGAFETALQALIQDWRGNYIFDHVTNKNGDVNIDASVVVAGEDRGDRVTFSSYLPH